MSNQSFGSKIKSRFNQFFFFMPVNLTLDTLIEDRTVETDSGGWKIFPTTNSDRTKWYLEAVTVQSLSPLATPPQYFYVQLDVMASFQCSDYNLLFASDGTTEGSCNKLGLLSCEWLQNVPRTMYHSCYFKCACLSDGCHGAVLVDETSNLQGMTMCPLQLA